MEEQLGKEVVVLHAMVREGASCEAAVRAKLQSTTALSHSLLRVWLEEVCAKFPSLALEVVSVMVCQLRKLEAPVAASVSNKPSYPPIACNAVTCRQINP